MKSDLERSVFYAALIEQEYGRKDLGDCRPLRGRHRATHPSDGAAICVASPRFAWVSTIAGKQL